MPRKRINSKAIKFTSDSDTVDIADSDNLSFTDGAGTDKPFSISAWVYVENIVTDKGVIISRRNKVGAGVQDGEWIIEHVNGKIKAYLYADNTYNEQAGFSTSNRLIFESSVANLTSATWHFITVTYDASQAITGLKVYKDGTEITANKTVEKNLYSGMPNYDIVTTIGGTDNPFLNTLEDYIADVVVFDKELSQAEVTEIYNGGKVKDMSKATTYNNIISWWKMGDDLDNYSAGGIMDYVGTNNGTLANGAYIVASPDLDTDLINTSDNHIYTSDGRTRQVKNAAGPFGAAITTPDAAPSLVTDGYATENQRYAHIAINTFPINSDNNKTVAVWGYNHAFAKWGRLTRGASGLKNIYVAANGNQFQLQHSQTTRPSSRYVLEIAGIDRIYIQNINGNATDQVFLGFNTF